MTAFIVFLFFMTFLQFIITLLIGSIAYLVIGLVLFCYMLIDELQNNALEARPKLFFEYHISDILILLNALTGVFRIVGGILLLKYIGILKIERKRSKLIVNDF